jgi:hypothetical protein
LAIGSATCFARMDEAQAKSKNTFTTEAQRHGEKQRQRQDPSPRRRRRATERTSRLAIGSAAGFAGVDKLKHVPQRRSRENNLKGRTRAHGGGEGHGGQIRAT